MGTKLPVSPLLKPEPKATAEDPTTTKKSGSSILGLDTTSVNKKDKTEKKKAEKNTANENTNGQIIGQNAKLLGGSIVTGASSGVDRIADFLPDIGAAHADKQARKSGSAVDKLTAVTSDIRRQQSNENHILGDKVKQYEDKIHARQVEIAEKNPDSKLAQTLYKGQQLAESMGNMMPAIAASMVTGGAAAIGGATAGVAGALSTAAATSAMSMNVFDQSLDDSLAQGYDYDKSVKKAIGDAALEAGTEILTGGFGGLGKGIVNARSMEAIAKATASNTVGQTLLKKLGAKNTVYQVAKIAAKASQIAETRTGKGLLMRAFGEGFEEMLSEGLSPFVERWTTNPEADNATVGEIIEAGLGGAIISVAMGGLGTVHAQIQNRIYDNRIAEAETKVNEAKNEAAQLKEKAQASGSEEDAARYTYAQEKAERMEEQLNEAKARRDSDPQSAAKEAINIVTNSQMFISSDARAQYDMARNLLMDAEAGQERVAALTEKLGVAAEEIAEDNFVEGIQDVNRRRLGETIIQESIDAGSTPEALATMWQRLKNEVWDPEMLEREDIAIHRTYIRNTREKYVMDDADVKAAIKEETDALNELQALASGNSSEEGLTEDVIDGQIIQNSTEDIIAAQQRYAEKQKAVERVKIEARKRINLEMALDTAVEKYGQEAVDQFAAYNRVREIVQGRAVLKDTEGKYRVFTRDQYAIDKYGKHLNELTGKERGAVNRAFTNEKKSAMAEVRKFVDDINNAIQSKMPGSNLRVEIGETEIGTIAQHSEGTITLNANEVLSAASARYYLAHEILHGAYAKFGSFEERNSFNEAIKSAMQAVNYDYRTWSRKLQKIYGDKLVERALAEGNSKGLAGKELKEFVNGRVIERVREETFARFMQTLFGSEDVMRAVANYDANQLEGIKEQLKNSAVADMTNTNWDFARLTVLDHITKALAMPESAENLTTALADAEAMAFKSIMGDFGYDGNIEENIRTYADDRGRMYDFTDRLVEMYNRPDPLQLQTKTHSLAEESNLHREAITVFADYVQSVENILGTQNHKVLALEELLDLSDLYANTKRYDDMADANLIDIMQSALNSLARIADGKEKKKDSVYAIENLLFSLYDIPLSEEVNAEHFLAKSGDSFGLKLASQKRARAILTEQADALANAVAMARNTFPNGVISTLLKNAEEYKPFETKSTAWTNALLRRAQIELQLCFAETLDLDKLVGLRSAGYKTETDRAIEFARSQVSKGEYELYQMRAADYDREADVINELRFGDPAWADRNVQVLKEITGFINDEDSSLTRTAEKLSQPSGEIDSQGNRMSIGQTLMFADSVMRDPSGRLIVWYHGANKGTGFASFKFDDPGVFVSDADIMSASYPYEDAFWSGKDYATIKTGAFAPEENFVTSEGIRTSAMTGEVLEKTMYPMYMDAKKVLTVDAHGSYWSEIDLSSIRDSAVLKLLVGKSSYQAAGVVTTDDIRRAAHKLGYDAVLIKSVQDYGTMLYSPHEHVPHYVGIALKPNILKLVDNTAPTISNNVMGFRSVDDGSARRGNAYGQIDAFESDLDLFADNLDVLEDYESMGIDEAIMAAVDDEESSDELKGVWTDLANLLDSAGNVGGYQNPKVIAANELWNTINGYIAAFDGGTLTDSQNASELASSIYQLYRTGSPDALKSFLKLTRFKTVPETLKKLPENYVGEKENAGVKSRDVFARSYNILRGYRGDIARAIGRAVKDYPDGAVARLVQAGKSTSEGWPAELDWFADPNTSTGKNLFGIELQTAFIKETKLLKEALNRTETFEIDHDNAVKFALASVPEKEYQKYVEMMTPLYEEEGRIAQAVIDGNAEPGEWEKIQERITEAQKNSGLYDTLTQPSGEYDAAGNPMSIGQTLMFKDSPIRDVTGHLKVMYHGTDNAKYAQLMPGGDGGIYLSDSEHMSASYPYSAALFEAVGGYDKSRSMKVKSGAFDPRNITGSDRLRDYIGAGDTHADGGSLYAMYLNAKNPLVIDAEDAVWNQINPKTIEDSGVVEALKDTEYYKANGGLVRTRDIANVAKNFGYDSVYIHNVYDWNSTDIDPMGERTSQSVVITYNPNDLKLADNLAPSIANNVMGFKSLNEDTSLFGTFDDYRNNPEAFEERIRQYQKQKEMYPPTVKDGLPSKLNDMTGTSQFASKVFTNKRTPESFKQEMMQSYLNGAYSYAIVTDKYAEKKAVNRLNAHTKLSDAYKDARSLLSNNAAVKKEDIAYAQQVLLEVLNQMVDLENKNQANPDGPQYNTTGIMNMAEKLTVDLCKQATRAGQNLQAFGLLKKLTPEGRLYYIDSQVNSILDELAYRGNNPLLIDKKGASKVGGFRYRKDPETGKMVRIEVSKALRDKMLACTSVEELDAVEKEIIADIAKQIPPTVTDRVVAWRYLAMLGNPRTHIRNIASNFAMGLAVRTKTKVGGVLEDLLLPNQTVGRTKTARSIDSDYKRAILDFAEMDWARDGVSDITLSGGKVGFQSMIEQQRNKLGFGKFNVLDTLAKINGNALEKEDNIAGKSAYKKAFLSYCAANNLNVDFLNSNTTASNTRLAQARSYAINEAAKATYHDANDLATMLNTLEHKNTLYRIIVGGLVPFKKTPANILKRGVAYSPVGFVFGAARLVNAFRSTYEDYVDTEFVNELKEKMDKGLITKEDYDELIKNSAGAQSKFAKNRNEAKDVDKSDSRYNAEALRTKAVADAIDLVASGLSGTALTALGYWLASLGLMKASGEDNDREEYYEEMLGAQKYSITVGNQNYTLDWLTPVSMPLFAGVEAYNIKNQDGEFDFSDFVQSLPRLADPVMNLSVLQGINDAMSSYSDNGLGDVIAASAEGYAGQFIPTLAGQVARTIDPVRRTTYAPKDTDNLFGKRGAKFVNKMENKVPGMSQQNAAYIDMWGRTEEGSDSAAIRLLENAVLPFYRKEVNKTEADDVVSRVFTSTGDRSVIPTSPESSYTFAEKDYYLTPEEYQMTKEMVGKISYMGVVSVSELSQFSDLPAEEQADLIADVYKFARAVAKKDYADANGLEYNEQSKMREKIMAGVESGMSLGEAIYVYSTINTFAADKDENGHAIAGTKKSKQFDFGYSLGLTDEQIDIFR